MNVAFTCKENGVLDNVQSRPGHLKHHKSKVIVCVKSGKPYHKQQHMHNLL
jgi:hypothetical protein